MRLQTQHLSKSFATKMVLNDFSVDFAPGKINCMMGPSGCGKTTLLRLLNGSIKTDAQESKKITDHISQVFQEPRLLPWLTVEQNIRFVAHNNEAARRCDEMLHLVDLSEYRKHYPGELSGGMLQRAAIARAFINSSEVILMDEPFKALDINLKLKLFDVLKTLFVASKSTVIFVTHDLDEAFLLSQHLIILSGTPTKVIASEKINYPLARELDTKEHYDFKYKYRNYF